MPPPPQRRRRLHAPRRQWRPQGALVTKTDARIAMATQLAPPAATSTVAAAKATLQETQRLQFGRKLAHPDKKVRDKSVKVLASLLQKRVLPDLEHERLWKGLFYCMWLADKVPIQQELANNLAELVHAPQKLHGLAYMRAFWVTMAREWQSIDYLRLDKFYSLMRAFIRHSFLWLKNREWALMAVQLWATQMSFTALSLSDKDTCTSIVHHIADVYWEELLKVVDHSTRLSPVVTCTLLQPFLHQLAHTPHQTIFARIVENVINPLLTTGQVTNVRLDDEEETPDGNLMSTLDLTDVPQVIQALAQDRLSSDKFRPELYKIHENLEAKVTELTPVQHTPVLPATPVSVPASTLRRNKLKPAAADATLINEPSVVAEPSSATSVSVEAEPEAITPKKTRKRSTAVPSSSLTTTETLPLADTTSHGRKRATTLSTPQQSQQHDQPQIPDGPPTPSSEVFVTAPSTPTSGSPAKTPTSTLKPILRSSSKTSSTTPLSSGKKGVRISLENNAIKSFKQALPPAAINNPQLRGVLETNTTIEPSPKGPPRKKAFSFF